MASSSRRSMYTNIFAPSRFNSSNHTGVLLSFISLFQTYTCLLLVGRTQISQHLSPSAIDQEELDTARAVAASMKSHLEYVEFKNSQLEEEVSEGSRRLVSLEKTVTEALEKMSRKMQELEQKEKNSSQVLKQGD
jgi:hypothetical protein